MESKVTYDKVKRGEPGYRMIQANKKRGMWICDSADHNENTGCSNPDCFKYNKKEDK